MECFTVEARFPLGEFNAHGPDGLAEWPPSPSRLLAALLATAYSLGDGVEFARALYELPPPMVTCPRRGGRDVGFGRWVPVNNELRYDAAGEPSGIVDAAHRFWDKASKAPECGSMVGRLDDDVVRWVFSCGEQGASIDLAALRAVARRVEYLGRPTSPVLLDVVEGRQEVPAGHDRWIPDPNGRAELQVGTSDLLRSLDRREEERRRSQFTGSHPSLPMRPVARYRCIGDAGEDQLSPPNPRVLLEGAVLYRIPQGRGVTVSAADAGMVLDQLRDALGEVAWMLPVFGQEGRERSERQVLRAVLVQGAAPVRNVPLAVRAGVTDAQATEVASMVSLPRLLRLVTAASNSWTTLVPVTRSREELRQELLELTDSLGPRLVQATLHERAQGDVGADADEACGSKHVTIVFEHAVVGPVLLDHLLMAPLGAVGLAVNPRRSGSSRER